MSRYDHENNSDARVVLYLAIMLPIVLSACGGLYLLAYLFGAPQESMSAPSRPANTAFYLIVLSSLFAGAGGLLSGVISDWMSHRIGQSPPRTKNIILIVSFVIFILLMVGGMFISAAQMGS